MPMLESRKRANEKYNRDNTKRVPVTYSRADNGLEVAEFVMQHGGSGFMRAMSTIVYERMTQGKVIDPALYADGHHVIETPEGERVHYDVEGEMVVDVLCARDSGDATRVKESRVTKFVALPTWAPWFVRCVTCGKWVIA